MSAVAALAVCTLLTLGCSSDTVSADTSAGTTTANSSDTSDSADTVADTSDSAMTDAETDTDDGPNDTDDSSGSFYAGPEPDWGGPALCDPFAQDCPQGEKCVPFSSDGDKVWDTNKCVPILGDGEPGDPCTYGGVFQATDDCDGSGMCWNVIEVDGQQVGICTPFCTGSLADPQCSNDAECLIANDNSITLCVETCDPLEQDCPAGQACHWLGDMFGCLVDASDPVAQSCDAVAQCPPGSACVQGPLVPDCESSACCAQYCSLADPTCTDPQTECAPFFDDPPLGAEDVGVCVAP